MVSDKVVAGPTDIRAARKAAGLSQTAAGALCHRTLRAWQAVEAGDRTLDLAAWELFLLRTGQHPSHKLCARPGASSASRNARPAAVNHQFLPPPARVKANVYPPASGAARKLADDLVCPHV